MHWMIAKRRWDWVIAHRSSDNPSVQIETILQATVVKQELERAYDVCLMVPHWCGLRRWSVHQAALSAETSKQKRRRWAQRRITICKSLPHVLVAMAKHDESLSSVQDCLYTAKDILVPEDYSRLEAQMREFVEKVCHITLLYIRDIFFTHRRCSGRMVLVSFTKTNFFLVPDSRTPCCRRL